MEKATDVNNFSGAVIAVKKDPENPYNTGISTQDSIPGKFHTDLKGHWGNKKGGHQTDNVMVFFPGEKAAPAPAPGATASVAPSTVDAPNPVFGVGFQHVDFVRPGGENGRAILTAPDTQNQVCVVAYNLGNLQKNKDGKPLAGNVQVPFGYAMDINGKKACRIEAWGVQDFFFDDHPQNVFLVHAKTQGSWKKIKEMQDNDWKEMVVVPAGGSNKFYNGIASFNGIPGKTHMNHRNYYGGSGDVNNKGPIIGNHENVRIYMPTQAPAAPVVPVAPSAETAPAAPSTADAPNPVFGVGFQHVEFVRPGGENGRAILTAPDTQKQVCAVAYKLGSLQNNKEGKPLPGEASIPFGHVLDVNGKKTCRIEAWGVHDYAFDDHPQNVFLVHAKTKGSWKLSSEMQANDWNELVIAKASGANKYNSGIASFNGIPGKTSMKNHTYYGGSSDVNNKGAVVSTDAKILIYLPTQEPAAPVVPAAPSAETAPVAPSTADAPNPWFAHDYSSDLIFIKLGQENGRAVLKYPEGDKQVCVAKTSFNNQDFVRFGYVMGTECITSLGGERKTDLNGEDARLVHVSKGGAWLPVPEAEAQGHITQDKMLLRNKALVNNLSPAYAKDVGTGAYYVDHKGLWYADGKGGEHHFSTDVAGNKEKTHIFVPGATATATAPAAPAAETPSAETTPAAPSTADAKPEPAITQTAQGPITEEQVLTAISEGRVIVEDPEVARQLETQKPISLDGESFKWVEFGKGFALQPVSLSPTSGVICRLFGPNNQAYIGNVYKNNRTTTSDIALSEIKVGEFVCRAGTDLQGNKVHITANIRRQLPCPVDDNYLVR